jgi:hypothetical protein
MKNLLYVALTGNCRYKSMQSSMQRLKLGRFRLAILHRINVTIRLNGEPSRIFYASLVLSRMALPPDPGPIPSVMRESVTSFSTRH